MGQGGSVAMLSLTDKDSEGKGGFVGKTEVTKGNEAREFERSCSVENACLRHSYSPDLSYP